MRKAREKTDPKTKTNRSSSTNNASGKKIDEDENDREKRIERRTYQFNSSLRLGNIKQWKAHEIRSNTHIHPSIHPTTNGTYCTFSKEISHFLPKPFLLKLFCRPCFLPQHHLFFFAWFIADVLLVFCFFFLLTLARCLFLLTLFFSTVSVLTHTHWFNENELLFTRQSNKINRHNYCLPFLVCIVSDPPFIILDAVKETRNIRWILDSESYQMNGSDLEDRLHAELNDKPVIFFTQKMFKNHLNWTNYHRLVPFV